MGLHNYVDAYCYNYTSYPSQEALLKKDKNLFSFMHLMVYHCNYTIQSFTGIANKMSHGGVIGSWLTACEPWRAYPQIFDPLLQIMKVTL
jgi:hypothetical protein